MKSILCAIIATLAIQASAQTGASKPTASSSATPGTPHTAADVKRSSSSMPTKQEVESFLHRMFGQDPAIKYEVLGISPSEIPGVAHVVVQVGGAQQPPTHLYVMPDGEHAIVGEVIPFGANPFAADRRKLDAQAHGPRTGSSQPRVTIVEFSDLQCPHCKAAQPILDKLLADTPGAQLIFQPFPLPMHDWASKAADMGACVAEQNQQAFWKYIHAVYDQQDQLTAANAGQKLQEIATNSGVDGAKASTCAQSQPTAKAIKDSVDLGTALGVTGTPTVFINGRKIRGIAEIPYDQLRQMVEFEATQK